MKKFLFITLLAALVPLSGCSDFLIIEETGQEEQTTEIVEVIETTEATTEAITETTTEEIFIDYDENAYVEYHFRTEKQLNQHFEKHGEEFDDIFSYGTAQDYEEGASNVINNPDALYKTEKEDGDGVYYLESTNEFVILSTDGYIRTYFRPSAGMSYFERQ